MVLPTTQVNSIKVAINCRSFMNRQYTGIGRYASRLVNALKEIDPQNQYLLYAPKSFFNTKRVIPSIRGKNVRIKIDRFSRGLCPTLGRFDIFHSPSPDIFDAGDAKVVVTIHDLVYKAFPEGHTAETLRLTDEQMQFLIPHCAKFICCSHNTAADLRRYFALPPEQISVIYPGVDRSLFYQLNEAERNQIREQLKARNIHKNFILFVGTLEPRKNLKNLLRAFSFMKERGYDGELVVCGMAGWDNEDLRQLAEALKIKAHVHFLGFIDDASLRGLYNLTDCFVFPSFYEGFGYPIVEAFNCGAPVVTSTFASCPEIAGEAAMTVDTREPILLASAILNVIGDRELSVRLTAAGLQRGREFDVRRTAEETLSVYKEVYEG